MCTCIIYIYIYIGGGLGGGARARPLGAPPHRWTVKEGLPRRNVLESRRTTILYNIIMIIIIIIISSSSSSSTSIIIIFITIYIYIYREREIYTYMCCIIVDYIILHNSDIVHDIIVYWPAECLRGPSGCHATFTRGIYEAG